MSEESEELVTDGLGNEVITAVGVLIEVTDWPGEREDVRLFIGEKLAEGEDVYKLVAVNNLLDAVDNEVGVFESDDDNDVDEELDADTLPVTLGLFETVDVRIPVFVFTDDIVLSFDCVSLIDDVRIAVLVDETEIEGEYEEELVVE